MDFRGGGFSSNFLSKGGMPVTMMRLNLIKGLGPVLQIAEGWTVEIDPEIHAESIPGSRAEHLIFFYIVHAYRDAEHGSKSD